MWRLHTLNHRVTALIWCHSRSHRLFKSLVHLCIKNWISRFGHLGRHGPTHILPDLRRINAALDSLTDKGAECG